MPALIRSRSVALVASSVALVLQPTLAYADWPPGGQTQFPGGNPSGQRNGTELSATASGVRFDTSKNGSGTTVGGLTPTTNWTPPPCWYAPTYTAEQFKKEKEAVWSQPSVGSEWVNGQRDRYVNGNPYKDFNIENSEKGYWWTSVPNPDRLADPAAFSCTEQDFWVDKGKAPPPVKNAVSPEILAGLAYGKVRVPDTVIRLNPTGVQTVNLNTWVWLDKAVFKPVSVTASVDVLGIWATTTATPIALHLDPGTKDADVYPASGDCAMNSDGSIGTPYTEGNSNKTPPCGLTYRRASTSGPYPLKATITWKVQWQGSGNTGGNLDNGTFGKTTDVVVQEIQAVVR